MDYKEQQPAFDTVTEALNWLMSKGYTQDFNLRNDCILFDNGKQSMLPEDFTIDYVFRYEGNTDPGDEDIVYGITSGTFGIKGVMISAFGVYADSVSNEMLNKLKIY